jgi:predicted ATPase
MEMGIGSMTPAKRTRPTTPEEEGIELYPDALERLERAVKTAARHGHIAADTIRQSPKKPALRRALKARPTRPR